jgi:pimeloyl-ACP methyl ester carboxylesterase
LRLLRKVLEILFLINDSTSKSKKEKRIKLNGIWISYLEIVSKGTPLIFIHGWAQSKEIWLNIAKNLSKTNSVYAIDLPGFGNSGYPDHPLVVSEYAEIINSFIKNKKIKKVIVIGHSFGGKIALELALRYPTNLQKLVIYSSDLNMDKSFLERMLQLSLNLLDFSIVKILSKTYLSLRGKSYDNFMLLAKTYRLNSKTIKFKRNLKNIKKKTFLVYGKLDFITSYKIGNELNAIFPDSKLAIFKKSSHFAHIEETTKFIEELRNFI